MRSPGWTFDVFVGSAFFEDFGKINNEGLCLGTGVGGIGFAGDLDVAFVGIVGEAARAENSFANGESFIARHLNKADAMDFAEDIDFANGLGELVEADDHGGLVIVSFLELDFDFLGQLFAGLADGRKAVDVGHLDVAVVSDGEGLGGHGFLGVFLVFENAEAEFVTESELVFVIQGGHGGEGVGARHGTTDHGTTDHGTTDHRTTDRGHTGVGSIKRDGSDGKEGKKQESKVES